MLKKQLLMLSASLLISISAFSQKNEIKAAEKALKKNDFTTALSVISKAESLIANADAKTKAKFYYIKGMALYANGTKPMNGEKAAAALEELMSVEKQSKSSKYSAEASQTISNIVIGINEQAAKDYDAAIQNSDLESFKKASSGFSRVYNLSAKDTSALYSASVASYYGKDYANSIIHFKKLIDLGFTGVTKTFKAENADGTFRYFNSKKDMDTNLRLGIVKNGKEEVSEPKTKSIYKYLALSYSATDKKEEAIQMITKARSFDPGDYSLILDEANLYYQIGDNAKYSEKIEEAIAIKPNDAILHFNVGTLNMDIDADKAKKHLSKAVELDPDFANAYANLGNLILKKLDAVQKELDAAGMDFNKYDKIKAEKMLPILQESLPHLEKSYELKATEGLKRQLNSLYENLEMEKRVE
jgi:tetratricopeptide (TPR) repeat protein